MPSPGIKRPMNDKKNFFRLIAIENISERFIYFRIFCQTDFSRFMLRLKSGRFSESLFLQDDYTKNPENFEINIIEKSTNKEELEALLKQYQEEFQEDLYPKTLFYSPPNYLPKEENIAFINVDEFCYIPGGV